MDTNKVESSLKPDVVQNPELLLKADVPTKFAKKEPKSKQADKIKPPKGARDFLPLQMAIR